MADETKDNGTEKPSPAPTIDIPIRDEHGAESNEAIEIPLDALPDAPNILGVLQAEKAGKKAELK